MKKHGLLRAHTHLMMRGNGGKKNLNAKNRRFLHFAKSLTKSINSEVKNMLTFDFVDI